MNYNYKKDLFLVSERCKYRKIHVTKYYDGWINGWMDTPARKESRLLK